MSNSGNKLTELQCVATDELFSTCQKMKSNLEDILFELLKLKKGTTEFDSFCESEEMLSMQAITEEFGMVAENFCTLNQDEEIDYE